MAFTPIGPEPLSPSRNRRKISRTVFASTESIASLFLTRLPRRSTSTALSPYADWGVLSPTTRAEVRQCVPQRYTPGLIPIGEGVSLARRRDATGQINAINAGA